MISSLTDSNPATSFKVTFGLSFLKKVTSGSFEFIDVVLFGSLYGLTLLFKSDCNFFNVFLSLIYFSLISITTQLLIKYLHNVIDF